MADGKIKISELGQALQINDDAVFPYTQDNSGTDATFKAPITQVARKIAEDVDYTNLNTTSKELVGAINQTVDNFAETYDSTATYNTGDPTLYGGTLYKCKADNVTGTWDSSKWKVAKAVDFGSGGGGGSGGHTIQNDSGTALTQRTTMQFKGAYSVDDSTNSKTVVNVGRSMLKADFDNLSADEKKGFIVVTDETSGANDRFQPVIYSEDEMEIGVWLDGKPLYQKSFQFSEALSVSYSSWTNTAISKTDYDTIIRAQCSTLAGSFIGEVLVNIPSGSDYLQLQTTRNGSNISAKYLTIYYTKLSDTAGSGQWTPQGVPAVHYSTDEQIIGTWIDGSTLYEKTVTGTCPSKGAYGKVADITSETITNARIISGSVYRDDSVVVDAGSLNFELYLLGGNLYGYNNDNSNTGKIVIATIQYTKSSS